MTTYRVYKLNRAGNFVSGDWIEAADDAVAKAAAHAMCDEATPTVELWQGSRPVAVLPCNEEAAA